MSLSELPFYPVEFYEVLKANDPDHYFKAVHVYKFNAGGTRYLATFEEYERHVYVLQFCLEESSETDDKFDRIANVGPAVAKKVLVTCASIGLSILRENPLASFFFTARPTADKLGKEGKGRNKRLSVYQYFAVFFFDSDHFTHSCSDQRGSYLILNKKYEQQEPDAKEKITDLLDTN
ncbi:MULTISPECIES: hypothetical protein [Chryseobacterium]|uniref:Uncharacterized protein n=1 Tax=Chryseobacterium camelliae TaxID=1265445 RepID=A0ABU0TFN0_9FLAO|nr:MULTISPECIES: hypothetical protein [Chryseobacterium]MDQ1095864.1 hypothetical protein [Chryseobacterium camelliae]MDR6131520.1 hypothetical protein [Chryseobacterium sp. SORGH_AS_1175]MDT3406337.1 hypothetical protein [Pseudacidovorax intermedius]